MCLVAFLGSRALARAVVVLAVAVAVVGRWFTVIGSAPLGLRLPRRRLSFGTLRGFIAIVR
jgi:hypothetical protein